MLKYLFPIKGVGRRCGVFMSPGATLKWRAEEENEQDLEQEEEDE
jgi:hypothetical protein